MLIERGQSLEIIAGPCSVDEENLRQIYDIAEIRIKNIRGEWQRAIWGTRMVGLKSRTELDSSGVGMGIDYRVLVENILILNNGGGQKDFIVPPSALMAREVIKKTGLHVASEIMMPEIQIPPLINSGIENGKLLLWNPSVDQLGWHVMQIAGLAKGRSWDVGLKNGKWLGTSLDKAYRCDLTSMEKTWIGLASFARDIDGTVILIHRGIDIPEKGSYRGLPVHELAARAKRCLREKNRHCLLYFDPSHSYGPFLRDQIVEGTIKAMRIRIGNDWLYDGMLIEVGDSKTDTKQHITIGELKAMAQEIARFREISFSR